MDYVDDEEVQEMRKCPVCGGNRIKLLYQTKLANVDNGLPDRVEVVVCDNCGFCYNNATASQNTICIM